MMVLRHFRHVDTKDVLITGSSSPQSTEDIAPRARLTCKKIKKKKKIRSLEVLVQTDYDFHVYPPTFYGDIEPGAK